MSLQLVGEKKSREASEKTGLNLVRVLRHSNDLWFGIVRTDEGHWHVRIAPSTWEWSLGDGCFSSCVQEDQPWGPLVEPPEGIRIKDWLSQELAFALKMIDWMRETLEFYGRPETYEEQPDHGDFSDPPIEDDRGALARAVMAALDETDEEEGEEEDG